MKTLYYGNIIIDDNLLTWTDSNNFCPSMLFDELDVELQDIDDAQIFSMWRQPFHSDTIEHNFVEWQVLQDGKWMDSVFFKHGLDERAVRRSLIDNDKYPLDIIVLPVKRG